MDYCDDCDRMLPDGANIGLLTESASAYEDGEYIEQCPYCGGDNILHLSEDRDE